VDFFLIALENMLDNVYDNCDRAHHAEAPLVHADQGGTFFMEDSMEPLKQPKNYDEQINNLVKCSTGR
jgi:hypothetical protein